MTGYYSWMFDIYNLNRQKMGHISYQLHCHRTLIFLNVLSINSNFPQAVQSSIIMNFHHQWSHWCGLIPKSHIFVLFPVCPLEFELRLWRIFIYIIGFMSTPSKSPSGLAAHNGPEHFTDLLLTAFPVMTLFFLIEHLNFVCNVFSKQIKAEQNLISRGPVERIWD